ncbi:MAG: DUF1080 domain-containing protein [Bacteroidaceae bacterium]|nr:DUF1080 domain-containing protein [Bacteroidaceae bacterium]
MKKSFNIILTAILMMVVTLSINAQDARQRTPETIVEDVLAQMPTQNQADFNREMDYLAQAAPKSIALLAGMLQVAEKHSNNLIEYAISGVTAYASTNAKYRNAVREGLTKAIGTAVDATAKDFLMQQLRLVANEEDAKVTYPEHAGAAPYAAAYDKLKSLGEGASDEVIKALKSKDHAYRMQALKFATDYNLANDELAKKIVKKYNSCNTEGKIDILNWLGDNKLGSQKEFLKKVIKKGGAPASAAIEALGRIGGEDVADELIALLGKGNSEDAFTALKSYRGDLNEKVKNALSKSITDGNAAGNMDPLLKLAFERRLRGASEEVFEISDKGLSKEAQKTLAGVVSPKDVNRVAGMLDKCPKDMIGDYQNILTSCVKSLEAKKQFETISSAVNQISNKERFYAPLVATNTDESVAAMKKIYEASKNPGALEALTKSTNYKAAPILLEAAKAGSEAALNSYVKLVNANEGDNDRKYSCLSEALTIAKSSNAKKNIISNLGNTPNRNAFLLVGKYLDDKDCGYTAAAAEKNIASKTNEDIEYEVMRANLTKAMNIYKNHGTADDGYAVDEIKKMMTEMEPVTPIVLSDEEKKQGFELLFDGTNLDNFVGNKVGYVPINGCINVTANYGNESNLYTKNEYRNFVFRFEFCFLRPGVNNGVGVRTPMGVDAAYDGMCEVQILDHDAPIYAGLREYQVHGSVYGVIPAKRIKHKPLGEWSEEEIRVEGNHIKVTVNGEVIVDGDIKEACKGHNVAPDGSNTNPYTVDHRNHPGMFNKTGHIGFLGHGAGLKFRNVRVLDLDKKPSKKRK